MKLVEIRDLDGPNAFLLEPAIKIELVIAPEDTTGEQIDAVTSRLRLPPRSRGNEPSGLATLAGALSIAAQRVHAAANLAPPAVVWEPLETPGHLAIAYGWSHRRAALAIARLIADAATGVAEITDHAPAAIAHVARTWEPDDRPLMMGDDERRIPVIGVTGTNGKTTTTRLIAHILRQAGLIVGWSSSSGVYIEGEQVLEGDYTGPAGARRVLDDEGVDAAVLETARGGILLRGIAYESNDVGVFINVSADHLDLQGIHTVDRLAWVKSTVVRVTRPEGYAVLNADDDLVRAVAKDVRAHVAFVSQDPRNVAVDAHVQAGGMALIARDRRVWLWKDGQAATLIDVADIPITFEGRARHMVENALCAAAACLALGRTEEEVKAGLRSFRSDAEHNLGRLNLFEVEGVRVIVDFAHNEDGLRHLLSLAHDFTATGGRVLSIIGTAGDRTDEALGRIGHLAGSSSDRVFIKETKKYLRGRKDNDELNALYVRGLRTAASAPWSIEADETSALAAALDAARPPDVIVMMCVEQIADVQTFLKARGRPIS